MSITDCMSLICCLGNKHTRFLGSKMFFFFFSVALTTDIDHWFLVTTSDILVSIQGIDCMIFKHNVLDIDLLLEGALSYHIQLISVFII